MKPVRQNRNSRSEGTQQSPVWLDAARRRQGAAADTRTLRTDAVGAMAVCHGYADSTAHVLHLLAVHPEHQGRGLGAEALAPFLAEVDAN